MRPASVLTSPTPSSASTPCPRPGAWRCRRLLQDSVHVRPSRPSPPHESRHPLYDCVDDADGSDFCTSDSVTVPVDEGCGATFNRYHAKIAWPVLRNVGPVTISVKTHYVPLGNTQLPLYIEVTRRTETDKECRTGRSGRLILVAQGGPECGGAWESAGPISLVRFGVNRWVRFTPSRRFSSNPFPTITARSCFTASGSLAYASRRIQTQSPRRPGATSKFFSGERWIRRECSAAAPSRMRIYGSAATAFTRLVGAHVLCDDLHLRPRHAAGYKARYADQPVGLTRAEVGTGERDYS